jgi:hypothetical protein
MKTNWGKALIALAVLIALGLFLAARRGSQAFAPATLATRDSTSTPALNATPPVTRPSLPSFGVRKANFTDDELRELSKKFALEMKPALEKWCNAYRGRIPFAPHMLAFENFQERIGHDPSFYLYTFILEGATITFRDSNGRVVVNYFRAPVADQLTARPTGGPPTVQPPVSRDEVIRMAKQDSGVDFRPGEILLRPSGVASALNGGVFVDVAPLGGNPQNGLCKISLVFGPDGNLVYYCRDTSI